MGKKLLKRDLPSKIEEQLEKVKAIISAQGPSLEAYYYSPAKRKFRNKRRYYRNLKKKAESYRLAISDDYWADMWHDHFDWDGRGNHSLRERKSHLDALFTAYEKVREQVKAYSKPYQLFIQICLEDASQDALYLHTPNPNDDNFPYDFDGIQTWELELPAFLSPYIKESLKLKIGMRLFDGKTWYVVMEEDTILPRPA